MPPVVDLYAIPPVLIEQWTGLSHSQAVRIKQGHQKLNRQALRLLTLHRQGKVLGPLWDGWSAKEGAIVDPDGNETTIEQLRSYFWIVQLARTLAQGDPAHQAEFYRLLGCA